MGTTSPANDRLTHRAAGILLHPTSLPSTHGVGDLGEGARRFVDWLADAGMSRWQVLPLVPAGPGNSPYATPAALAGHPLLVDLHGLADAGLLAQAALKAPPFPVDWCDFPAVTAFKEERLAAAAIALHEGRNPAWKVDFETFVHGQRWAREAAVFLAIRESYQGQPWWSWEPGLRDRDPSALKQAEAHHAQAIDRHLARFFFFERQWAALRAHAHDKGVKLIGDVPIYVDRDSVDVWSNRSQFRLDAHGEPEFIAGVPPDFFSKKGQRWGNPLYAWDKMAADGHAWWVERLRRALTQVDVVRLDHFRGFSAFWEIPAADDDATRGKWAQGPGRALFDDLAKALGDLPLIAEDLGDIDDAVHELRDGLALPGMCILQFAFGEGADHPFLPHNLKARSVIYTGTHDNDTTLGWWQTTSDAVRDHARRYLAVSGNDIVWDMMREAFSSVADLAVVPLQDVLCLDGGSRMNTPAVADGNWRWRVRMAAFNQSLATRLREVVTVYGRAPERAKASAKP